MQPYRGRTARRLTTAGRSDLLIAGFSAVACGLAAATSRAARPVAASGATTLLVIALYVVLSPWILTRLPARSSCRGRRSERAAGMRVLSIATVAQSLVLQSPMSWEVLRQMGAQITFAAAADGWEAQLVAYGRFEPLRTSRSPFSGRHATSVLQLRRLLAEDWDLVQVQSAIAGALTRLVVPRTRRYPLLYVAHGFHFHRDQLPPLNAMYRAAEWSLAARCDALAVVSKEDLAAARRLGIDQRTLLWRLPGAGVDVTRFAAASRSQGERMTALFCGELTRNKDPLFAVRVIDEMRRRGACLDLTIIGDGPLRDRVDRARTARLDWMTIVPSTREMPRYMGDAALLLSPSWREGLPRVVVEALAAGTPVLARENRGSRELLAGRLPGLMPLMPRYATPEQWAAAGVGILRCPPPTSALQAQAGHYSSAAFVPAYRGLVEAVLARAPARRTGSSW